MSVRGASLGVDALPTGGGGGAAKGSPRALVKGISNKQPGPNSPPCIKVRDGRLLGGIAQSVCTKPGIFPSSGCYQSAFLTHAHVLRQEEFSLGEGDNSMNLELNHVQSTDLWPQSQNCTANKPSSEDLNDKASSLAESVHIEAGSSSDSSYRRTGKPPRSPQQQQP